MHHGPSHRGLGAPPTTGSTDSNVVTMRRHLQTLLCLLFLGVCLCPVALAGDQLDYREQRQLRLRGGFSGTTGFITPLVEDGFMIAVLGGDLRFGAQLVDTFALLADLHVVGGIGYKYRPDVAHTTFCATALVEYNPMNYFFLSAGAGAGAGVNPPSEAHAVLHARVGGYPAIWVDWRSRFAPMIAADLRLHLPSEEAEQTLVELSISVGFDAF